MRKSRARHQPEVRQILEFANSDPMALWHRYKDWAERRELWRHFSPETVRALHRRVSQVLSEIALRDEMHALLSDDLDVRRHESYWEWDASQYERLLDLRSRGHMAGKLLDDMVEIQREYPAATQLLFPRDAWRPPQEEVFYQSLTLVVTDALDGKYGLHRCNRPSCENLYVEDRHIANPALRQKFCSKRCRDTYHNERRGPAYFREAKRRSREKAQQSEG